MPHQRQVTLGIPCRAKTRKQMEAPGYAESKIGCSYDALVYCDDYGNIVAEDKGTPVCTKHRQLWKNGRYYGVN